MLLRLNLTDLKFVLLADFERFDLNLTDLMLVLPEYPDPPDLNLIDLIGYLFLLADLLSCLIAQLVVLVWLVVLQMLIVLYPLKTHNLETLNQQQFLIGLLLMLLLFLVHLV